MIRFIDPPSINPTHHPSPPAHHLHPIHADWSSPWSFFSVPPCANASNSFLWPAWSHLTSSTRTPFPSQLIKVLNWTSFSVPPWWHPQRHCIGTRISGRWLSCSRNGCFRGAFSCRFRRFIWLVWRFTCLACHRSRSFWPRISWSFLRTCYRTPLTVSFLQGWRTFWTDPSVCWWNSCRSWPPPCSFSLRIPPLPWACSPHRSRTWTGSCCRFCRRTCQGWVRSGSLGSLHRLCYIWRIAVYWTRIFIRPS